MSFADKYKMQEIIGRGRSTTIRKCINKANSRLCAVKIIKLNEENKKAILEESKICALLKHQYIVELIECFQTDQFAFLVFEFINGVDLCTEIEARSRSGYIYSEADLAGPGTSGNLCTCTFYVLPLDRSSYADETADQIETVPYLQRNRRMPYTTIKERWKENSALCRDAAITTVAQLLFADFEHLLSANSGSLVGKLDPEGQMPKTKQGSPQGNINPGARTQ
ncbi:hypothetical protein GJ496_006070 [Pomphorhynchus laevis]|nr:hypothetical protein GJ496_006070 [Pomphorhynchus laevis]